MVLLMRSYFTYLLYKEIQTCVTWLDSALKIECRWTLLIIFFTSNLINHYSQHWSCESVAIFIADCMKLCILQRKMYTQPEYIEGQLCKICIAVLLQVIPIFYAPICETPWTHLLYFRSASTEGLIKEGKSHIYLSGLIVGGLQYPSEWQIYPHPDVILRPRLAR